jgi:hypothetical protein
VVQKGGEGDPTGTINTTYDLSEGIVLESEAAVPSGKVTTTLSHAGAVPGFKVRLSR